MSWTVYRHITPSGKSYIGITSKKPEYRWKNGRGYNPKFPFGKAIEKYGWENIRHEILDTNIDEFEAKCLEEYYIFSYRTYVGFSDCNGYNLTLGGDGQVGWEPTEESRIKNSEAHKGKTPWIKGKHHTDETRRKMSNSQKGNSHHKGHHHSDETRRKQSEANKGQIPWNKGIPAWNKGIPQTEDAKRKNRESHKGKHRVYHEDGTFHMER